MTTAEDRAVEVAAEALHEASDHGQDGGVRYGYLCNCREKARLAVEAAAPYLRAGPNLLSDTWQQRAERAEAEKASWVLDLLARAEQAEAEVERMTKWAARMMGGTARITFAREVYEERALADRLAEALQGMNYQLIGPDQLTPEPWKKRKKALDAWKEARRG